MRFNFAVFASLVSAALARDVKVLSAFLVEPVSSCIFAIGVPLVTLLLSLPKLQFQGAWVSFSGFLKRVQAVPSMYSDLFKLFLSS